VLHSSYLIHSNIVLAFKENSVRRVNVGGKLLSNMLKELVTYRQWNMMDEFDLINDAKEKLCYASLDLLHDLRGAAREKSFRKYDREFVLPDFVQCFEGRVRTPASLKCKRNEGMIVHDSSCQTRVPDGQHKSIPSNENVDNDSMDTVKSKLSVNEELKNNNLTDTQNNPEDSCIQKDNNELLSLEKEELDKQALLLSTERFAVPETLFRPHYIGLAQKGVVEAIIHAVEACDRSLHAAMYHNILLVGGNARIPQIKDRIYNDLRALVPSRYKVRILVPNDPISFAWQGMYMFSGNPHFLRDFATDKKSWERAINERLGQNKSQESS